MALDSADMGNPGVETADHSVFDDRPDGVIVAGPDGLVEYVNPRIVAMARARDDEMLGMHLSDAMPFDDLNGNSWYDSTHPYDGLNIRNRLSEQSWYSPRGSEYLITASLKRDRPGGTVQRVVISVRSARAHQIGKLLHHRAAAEPEGQARTSTDPASPLLHIKSRPSFAVHARR